jgi:tetratricopeptide (TPR) repeat protein
MQIIKLLIALIFTAVFSANADTQPRGPDRLRELVVFPEMNLNFAFGLSSQGNNAIIADGENLPDEISQLREELKQQSDDIKLLLRLGNVLDSNGETNESLSYYKKAEQLCRNKLAVNSQDGLTLIDLGEALHKLDKNEEAESFYRRATLVSSNEWRCWVGLGNFLANGYLSLFPGNLRNQIGAAQMPSQAVLDYRPSPDALDKSMAQCDEASRCFDRAMALAPKEPEVFFQRAGYLCSSNLQNCLFRNFRDNEKLDYNTWLLAVFSKEVIASLQEAADLSPQNYKYISLAAYFEWFNAVTQTKPTSLTLDALPDAARKFIHDAMTRLENLSEDPDKTTAAGALENLGMLNIMFGNALVAATDLRRAVSLSPSRDQIWDLLLISLGKSPSHEEVMALCESRLKYKDSARNHLLLARAFERQKKWDKAGEQAQAALKLEPENIVAHLELTALDLTQSADTNFMAKASEQYTRTQSTYEKLPDNNEKWSHWRELMLNLAILDGLVNSPEYQKAAKACLEAVSQRYPNDKQVKEISNALE